LADLKPAPRPVLPPGEYNEINTAAVCYHLKQEI